MKLWITLVVAVAAVAAPVAATEERNLFEWTQVAPVVVTGTSLGENGRFVEFRVDRALRGDVRSGEVLRLDVKFANRERDRLLYPKALRLDGGVDYVVLLDAAEPRKRKAAFYRVVRGVDGARELPLEGRPAFLDALERFIAVQGTPSDAVLWSELRRMLGEVNPLLLRSALGQFIKFRRGDPELLLTVRPLLDHPQIELRADAARLIGQILARHAGRSAVPEEDSLLAELVARARRDEAVTVRVAATEALAELPGGRVADLLREIAESDPEQQVRYAAEVALLDRGDAAAGRDGGRGAD